MPKAKCCSRRSIKLTKANTTKAKAKAQAGVKAKHTGPKKATPKWEQAKKAKVKCVKCARTSGPR